MKDASLPPIPKSRNYQFVPRIRPRGVTMLALLNLIGGSVSCFQLFSIAKDLSDVESPMQAIGMPPELEFVGATFLMLLTFATGVGIWRGAQWGWWCSAFYSMYGIFRNTSTALVFLAYAEQVDGPRDPELAVLKHCFRAIFYGLVFSYVMWPHVLAFFDLPELNKRAAFWKIVGLCLTISAGAYLAAKLLS